MFTELAETIGQTTQAWAGVLAFPISVLPHPPSAIRHPPWSLLAYRPFLDPLPIHGGWMWLIIPLIVVISMVYKTIKSEDLSQLPRQTLNLSLQILVFLILAAAALWLVTEMI